ncbi:uncharacterized protein PV09_03546 [Verruconis gallopava]|uniref:Tetratricopeptide SHNi-TPR domain-containing protein n=1 Tax=Verruconis gallopava TaxID=253628 RepID=A0A0D2AFD9_9PEZI|nr:uncharacterized protein PV09_03546 [Verruconis gallopava]KIW05683.1 hypothetical protein PV09_03546 [Verruconis gallopava]
MAETEDTPSREKLTELTNAANLKYSLKNYNEAAELYSRATEMQGILNGDEMAPENAELLYLYGRCLYKVAVSKSDVLGGQVAGEKQKASKAETSKAAAAPSPGQKLAEDVVEAVIEEKEGGEERKKDAKSANQPYFQLVDAEWSDDEEEDEDADGEVQEAIEEEDDFATAYEILDLARLLLERQMQALQESDESSAKGKGKMEAIEMSPKLRHVKERLADTHDLQAEISLENEKFAEAITDFEAAATIKDELYPKASSIVAEVHYKLSLALEFESMSAVREAQAKESEGTKAPAGEKPEVDEKLRERAREETSIAIESIKLRIVEEESKLAGLEGDALKKKQEEIAEVKEILKEMEDRLEELHAPAVTINGPAGAPEGDAVGGILAQVLGETPAEQKARIEEATKNANDLSGLVKKKKPKASGPSSGTAAAPSGSGAKRKLDEEVAGDGDIKRARTEELTDATS